MSFDPIIKPFDKNPALPLRVLMVIPHYPFPVLGGSERQVHELAKALLELGVEVQALSGGTEPFHHQQEWVEGILVHRIPWSRKKWVRFIRMPFDLLHVLFNERRTYDVVHLHQHTWFGFFVILTARLLGKPVLTKIPNDGRYGLLVAAASRLGWLKMALFKRSDAVVAMTKLTLNELEEIGFPSGRVLFAPNGIRVPRCDARIIIKKANGKDICRVVFVGGLREQKGVENLLHAWCGVVDNAKQSVQLELWGSGPQEAELKALCQNLKIENSVVFRGYVESVHEKLKEMDVFVLPSLGEGNSNAILEAMAVGLPVVSTRVGGALMQVGTDGAHFLVEPGDRAGLRTCLLELIENAELRKHIGALMQQRILTHFEIHKVAQIYAAAYALLVEEKRDHMGGVNKSMIAEN